MQLIVLKVFFIRTDQLVAEMDHNEYKYKDDLRNTDFDKTILYEFGLDASNVLILFLIG